MYTNMTTRHCNNQARPKNITTCTLNIISNNKYKIIISKK